jgi:hypothetical protein
MVKTNNLVLDLLVVPEISNVRQRKISMEETTSHLLDEDKQTKCKGRKQHFQRSISVDSGVYLTPPSSPNIYSPLGQMPCSNVYGQQGSLAFSFAVENEMALEKLKQE